MQFESFKSMRWIRSTNLVLQTILILTFVFGLNYLAPFYPAWRHDFTKNSQQSLSPETLAYVGGLKRSVHVVVTVDGNNADDRMFSNVRNLLREYELASAANPPNARISVEYLNPIENTARAEQLGTKEAGLIFFQCEGKTRTATLGELKSVKAGNLSEFLGEQVFTASILDVASEKKTKVYFLTGHGELQLNDTSPARGLSQLRDQLLLRNFSLETLDIVRTRKVPDDAALIVIVGPDRIEPFVQEQLQQYLRNRDGNVLLFLAPRTNSGLFNLLYDWGMHYPGTDILVDTDPASITDDHNLRINGVDPKHPITKVLNDTQQPLIMGLAGTLERLPLSLNGVTCTPIAGTTSKTAYAAKGDLSPRFAPPPSTNPNYQLNVAMAAERVQARGNLTFSVRGGRLVVFGSADMVSNRFFEAIPGNQYAVMNSVNWTTDRDAQLGIPPRPIEKYQLSLSQAQLSHLRLSLLFITPGAVALLGILVYWSRRS